MKTFLLISVSAALIFCSACSMLIRQDPPLRTDQNNAENTADPANPQEKKMQPLTDKQIAEMSPEELERYLEERKRRESARKFSDELAPAKLSEQDRRNMRSNVSRPLTPEERGSAFPWKNEPGSRSESLRGTTTFGH